MIIGLQWVRDSSEMLKDYVISFTVAGYTVHG